MIKDEAVCECKENFYGNPQERCGKRNNTVLNDSVKLNFNQKNSILKNIQVKAKSRVGMLV